MLIEQSSIRELPHPSLREENTPVCPNPTASLPLLQPFRHRVPPGRNGHPQKGSDSHQKPDEESRTHRGQYQLNGGMVHVNRLLPPGLFESLHNEEVQKVCQKGFLEGLFVSVRRKVLVVSTLTDELFSGKRCKQIEGRGPLWAECYLHG